MDGSFFERLQSAFVFSAVDDAMLPRRLAPMFPRKASTFERCVRLHRLDDQTRHSFETRLLCRFNSVAPSPGMILRLLRADARDHFFNEEIAAQPTVGLNAKNEFFEKARIDAYVHGYDVVRIQILMSHAREMPEAVRSVKRSDRTY